MTEKPVANEERRNIGANGTLWLPQPVLRQRTGKTYVGRIFVEVWDGKDAHVVEDSVGLRQVALAALKSASGFVRDPVVPLTNEPATGNLADQSFQGRVIIEVWNDTAIVGISGSQEQQVVQRALQMLEQG